MTAREETEVYKSKRIFRAVTLCLATMLCLNCFSGCAQRRGKIRRPLGSGGNSATASTYETEEETYEAYPEGGTPEETTYFPEPTESDENGPLLYGDSRIPHYSGTDPDWRKVEFTWDCQDKLHYVTVDIPMDANMYRYYKSLDRYNVISEYHMYVNDANNRRVVQGIVDEVRDIAEQLHYDAGGVAREIVCFVQQCIEYQLDSDTSGRDEYPRYPIETLYERQGDCEDTSILMAALLKEYGFEVGFFDFPGHAAVALRTSDDYDDGDYFIYNGHRYLYIESTATGWEIGDVPEEYQTVEGKLYLVS